MQKVIIDYNDYVISYNENEDILLKKNNIINISDINNVIKYNFTKSNILSCIINGKEYNRLKYKSILEQIYILIDDGIKIIKTSKLNIKTIEKKDEGFYYIDKIGISVQGVDSNKCLYKIINQCINI